MLKYLTDERRANWPVQLDNLRLPDHLFPYPERLVIPKPVPAESWSADALKVNELIFASRFSSSVSMERAYNCYGRRHRNNNVGRAAHVLFWIIIPS